MDVSERQAQLNTQIRFHNYKAALPLAYALRLELQLLPNRTERQNEQMDKVELNIKQLEHLTEPFYGKFSRWLWHKFVEPSNEPPLPPIYEEEPAEEPRESKKPEEGGARE